MQKETYQYGKLDKRLVAKGIDIVCAVGLVFVSSNLPLPALLPQLAWLGALVYILLADGLPGGSIGKRMMGLSVINWKTGRPCSYFESATRNFLLFAFAGFLRLLQEAEEQRAIENGDFSGTVVVSTRSPDQSEDEHPLDDPNREPVKVNLTGLIRKDNEQD